MDSFVRKEACDGLFKCSKKNHVASFKGNNIPFHMYSSNYDAKNI